MAIVATAVAAATAGASGAGTVSLASLASSCPSAADIAAFDVDLKLTFEGDPTAGTLVCTGAAGSRDLTRLQERAYQTLRVMRDISFDAPLPWTSKPLYEWLRDAIDGIRFRNDIDVSFCCEPDRVINIQTRNLAAISREAPEKDMPSALVYTALLFAHEARHSEGRPHSCGSADRAPEELGAWGIQRALLNLYALRTGGQLDMPGPTPDSWRTQLVSSVQHLWNGGLFCDGPAGDVAVAVERRARVAPGGTAPLRVTVTNVGGIESRGTRIYVTPPQDVRLVAGQPSQGACGLVGVHAFLCDLGTLPPSATATVDLRLAAGKRTGSGGGAVRVFGDLRDVGWRNDLAVFEFHVLSPPRAKAPPCRRGQKPTPKKPCRRR